MKHERRIPAWLLRDLPALAGMFACFWLFIIPVIKEGFRLARGGRPQPHRMQRIAHHLLNAEATLAFALWRQAYRRLGYNPRDVRLELAELPTSHDELMGRMRSYTDQIQNLSRASEAYVAELARRVGASARAAHAPAFATLRRGMSTDARLRRAAQHEPVRVNARRSSKARVALILSRPHRGRPSKDERVLAHARGPPKLPDCLFPIPHSLSAQRD